MLVTLDLEFTLTSLRRYLVSLVIGGQCLGSSIGSSLRLRTQLHGTLWPETPSRSCSDNAWGAQLDLHCDYGHNCTEHFGQRHLPEAVQTMLGELNWIFTAITDTIA